VRAAARARPRLPLRVWSQDRRSAAVSRLWWCICNYAQAIGIERLRLLMAEIFGLSISEGALINILARAKPKLEACGETIANQVRAAAVVCSDETLVRVCGRNWWEWVFVTGAAVLHLIRPSRGRCVPQEVFGQGWQGVWVSDAYCSQRGNAATWQMCLAHLLRDTQYVIDCGDTQFSRCFKKLLLRAIIIGRRRPDLDDAQLALREADLHRRLDRIVDCTPPSPEATRLHRRLIRDRKHLLVCGGKSGEGEALRHGGRSFSVSQALPASLRPRNAVRKFGGLGLPQAARAA
jgi:transposase